MYIMTEFGWRALARPCRPPTPDDQVKADCRSTYKGPLPSQEALAFIAQCAQAHKDYLAHRFQ